MNTDGLPDTPSEQARYDVMIDEAQKLRAELSRLSASNMHLISENHKLSAACGVRPCHVPPTETANDPVSTQEAAS